MASCFAGSHDFVGVKGGEHIKYAGGREQASSVVAVGVGDIGSVGLQCSRHKVKTAGAEVGNIAKLGESVFTIARENIASHTGAKDDQQRHGGKTGGGGGGGF